MSVEASGVEVTVRPEEPDDEPSVRSVHLAAFESPLEADLVDTLRREGRSIVSLVAAAAGVVVGHVLLSEVTLHGGVARLLGLGPMAVLPSRQRTGVGQLLVRASLERSADLGYDAVVVLGHPTYYPRFGFEPAERFGLQCEFDVPSEVFMTCELRSGSLRDVSGRVRYAAAFGTP